MKLPKKFIIYLIPLIILWTASYAFSVRWDSGWGDSATTTSKGVVELATDAETATGTSDSVVCTPGNIAAINAYKTIYIDAGAMVPATTNGAQFGTHEYGTNDLDFDYMAFDDATEEYAHFKMPMPEGWDRGTIKAKFYWSSATSSTANDTVEWQIAGQAISDSDPLDVALGDAGEVISDVLLANNGTDLQITAKTPAITIGGTPALADLIHFKVSRNVAGTDDMVEDAHLFGVWIQYKETNQIAAW